MLVKRSSQNRMPSHVTLYLQDQFSDSFVERYPLHTYVYAASRRPMYNLPLVSREWPYTQYGLLETPWNGD